MPIQAIILFTFLFVSALLIGNWLQKEEKKRLNNQ